MPSPSLDERRRSQRLPAVPNQAVLEWWDGSQEKSSQGQILNISTHGALVSSDHLPDLGRKVMVRLNRPVRTDWCGSIAARHRRGNEAAMDFCVDCPYDLVFAATLGLDILGSMLGLNACDRFSSSGD